MESSCQGYADQIGEAWAALASLAQSERTVRTHRAVCAALMDAAADTAYAMNRIHEALEEGQIINSDWCEVWEGAAISMSGTAAYARGAHARGPTR